MYCLAAIATNTSLSLSTLPAIDHPPPPLLLCARGKTIFKIKDDARRAGPCVNTHSAILTFLTVFRQTRVLFQSRSCCLFCPLNFSFDTKRRAVFFPPASSSLYKIDIIQHQFLKRNVITLEWILIHIVATQYIFSDSFVINFDFFCYFFHRKISSM